MAATLPAPGAIAAEGTLVWVRLSEVLTQPCLKLEQL